MNYEERYDATPVQHIRNLLDSIEDGKLTVEYYGNGLEDEYSVTYDVTCTPADAEKFIEKYEKLTAILEATAAVKDKIAAGEDPKALLTPEQLYVWSTFIRDLEDTFDAGEYDIDELEENEFLGVELTEEERDTIARHVEWLKAQYNARMGGSASLANPICYIAMRARRYEQLVYLKAPRIVLEEEGRCLAREIILYESAK